MTATKIYETEMDYNPEYLDVEDSGCAKIYSVVDTDEEDLNGIFVKVQSWYDNGYHPEMDALVGKRIRVTVEILDD